MKVKMKVQRVGPTVNDKVGDVLDVTEEQAQRLIDAGQAEAVEDDKPKKKSGNRKSGKKKSQEDAEKATDKDAENAEKR